MIMLSHVKAWAIVDAVRSSILDSQKTAAIAVADRNGELLAFLRMDGCPLPASTIAVNKAFAAAREGISTRRLGAELKASGYSLLDMGDPRYTTFPGGFPIKRNGEVVGGIGVSGIYDDHSDEWFANLGLERFGFSSWSENYKKERGLENGLVRTVFQACAEYLVEAANIQANDRVMDIGCGSGVVGRVSLHAEPGLKQVLGIDLSPEAIEVAQEESKDPRLVYKVGDALEESCYRPGSWDVLFAQHLVPQVPECLPRIRQSLRPGGRALVCTWPETLTDCQAYDFLYTAAGERHQKTGGYGGWSLDQLRASLKAAGFVDVNPLPCGDSLHTPAITPDEFLRQYFDGSVRWLKQSVEDKRRLLGDRDRLSQLAESLTGRKADSEGRFMFGIGINAVIARAE